MTQNDRSVNNMRVRTRSLWTCALLVLGLLFVVPSFAARTNHAREWENQEEKKTYGTVWSSKAFTHALTAKALELHALANDAAVAGAESSGGLLGGEQQEESSNSLSEAGIYNLFREWVQFHEKAYDETEEEHALRFKNFKTNLKYIAQDNRRREGSRRANSYTLGLNSLADLSVEEFQSTRLGTHPDPNLRGALPQRAIGSDLAFVPGAVGDDSVDWREKGAVTEVKNQARCGSCWSFSTTGSIEGINAIVSGNLTSLSEQELVDCDTQFDHGCQGGLMDYAFKFVKKHGLDTEKDYPYEGVQGVCDTARENRVVVTIDGFHDIASGNESEMVEAVSKHPVSVAIQANQQSFQLYTGGVFDDEGCGTQLDHGVLVVGYGTSEDDQDYWIMKNSWGALWGEEGFMKMAMGVSPSGICGIAKMASYPIKKSVDPPPPPPTPPSPPKPPSPKVVCNQYQQCAENTTCCCMIELLGKCLAYSCCPYQEAVCCDDHQHCCPHTTTCNTEEGVCEKSSTTFEGEHTSNTSIPMKSNKMAQFSILGA